jgi:hypothetical protein
MAASKRLAIGERLLSAAGLVILVFALGAANDRFRDRASMLVTGGPPMADMADAGERVGGLAGTAVHFARVWSGDHVSLTVFAVAGLVLLVAVRKL